METPCECCQNIIPKFDNFSKEDEVIVRQKYREFGPITAINELKEITNCRLIEAKIWVDHCGEGVSRKTIPCPYCGELLRTFEAKQCRFCLRDWHDETKLRFLK
jgi:hypothetical protein